MATEGEPISFFISKDQTLTLEDKGYLRISDLITKRETQIILSTLNRCESLSSRPVRLIDSTDVSNRLYSSRRSPGLQYAYLESVYTQAIGRRVATALQKRTQLNWWDGINKYFLPVFSYKDKAFIKAHRGRDIGYGVNNYVAVGMLTNPGIDFNGGEFYLNPHAKASPDGKTVWNDKIKDRIFFRLQRGEILIFNNQRFVHGTTPVSDTDFKSAHRLTCSWRTSATSP